MAATFASLEVPETINHTFNARHKFAFVEAN